VTPCYEADDDLEKAETVTDRMMDLDESDGDHVGQAIDIHLERGRIDDAKAAFRRLQDVDPIKATVMSTFSSSKFSQLTD
jgi:DNA-binding SARP family transcriptional activator